MFVTNKFNKYNGERFKKMNDIFYNPPLPPLQMRGISGIHFFESTLDQSFMLF